MLVPIPTSAVKAAHATHELPVYSEAVHPSDTMASRSDVNRTKVVAPASTFYMLPKQSGSFPKFGPAQPWAGSSNLQHALGTPYADLTQSDTIVIISQPPGQACAVVGGIMARRMQHLGAQGIVVDGRVRDLGTLKEMDIPVWSKGTSVIGAGAETKFHAKEIPVWIGKVKVEPGDIVMIDQEERGVVCVPRGLVDKVLDMLPGMVRADERVMIDVMEGATVANAFATWRN